MDNTQLLSTLQEILEFEYTDIFIYNNEANLFKQKIKNSQNIVTLYKTFALDELSHADIISKKIIELDGAPIWQYKQINLTNSIRESIKHHIERELKAIQTYTNLIKIISDRTFKTQLKGILANEKEHLEELSKFLKNLVLP